LYHIITCINIIITTKNNITIMTTFDLYSSYSGYSEHTEVLSGTLAVLLLHCGFCYLSLYAAGDCFSMAFLVFMFLVIAMLSYMLGY
jgi:hypothetical protein